jgi:raffinose/stachyose/melibiose transport system permease protein
MRLRGIKDGLVRHAVLIALSILSLLPLYFMLGSAFKTQVDYAKSQVAPPTSPTLDNFRQVFDQALFGRWILNSFFVTFVSVGLAIVLSTFAAYAFAQIPFPGSGVMFRLTATLMAVPVVAVIIPLFRFMVDTGLIDSFTSVIVVYVAFMIPYTTFFLTAFFRQLPRAVFEAARIDGCGHVALLRRMAVPLSLPALITLALVNALWAWNELLIALVLLQDDSKRTLMVGLTVFQDRFGTNVPVTMAGLAVSFAPIFVMYIVGLRYFVSGIIAGSVSGE